MSRIYFHSCEKTVEVQGIERGWARWLCYQLLDVALGNDKFDDESNHPSPLRKLLPPECYVNKLSYLQFRDGLTTWLQATDRSFHIDGLEVLTLDAACNTAHMLGSPSMQLLARLHAQCESHCYVEWQHSEWLASMIADGLSVGIMRQNMGWEHVLQLLNETHGPVVTSYSVSRMFPNYQIARARDDSEPTDDADEPHIQVFDILTHDERWNLGIAGLRQRNAMLGLYGLEMKPSNWAGYYYGSNRYNGFTLRAFAERLARESGDAT